MEALLEFFFFFFAWEPQTLIPAIDGNHTKGKAMGENIHLSKKES